MTIIDPYKFAPFVILGNGEYPSHPLPRLIMTQARFLAVCDGAANKYVKSGQPFDIIIGDGDSIDNDIRSQYTSKIIISDDQETNDQTKAVSYMASKDMKEIAIIGATGMREDHTLGNISLLIEYHKQGINAKIYTDYGLFFVAEGNNTIKSQSGQQISIFNVNCNTLSAKGLQYPIYPFSQWWQGTLNQATDNNITIIADNIYLIYMAYTE